MINAAMIGCGAIAEEHLKALAEVEGIAVQAYCDLDAARAGALLNRYGGAYATDDVARVLADDSIDAVYICTHHDSHESIAVAAAHAGRHIMMEKPLALTVEGCRAIGDAVERAGVTMMTAFKLRYYPMVARARAFVGRPLIAIAQVMDTRWPDEFWAQDPVRGGGNVLSQGCHAVDMLCLLMGADPIAVYAECGALTHPGAAVFDSVVATLRFPDGRIASWAQSDAGAAPYVSKFSFQVADGLRSVHLHDRLKRGDFFDGERTEIVEDAGELGMIEENREFVRALATGTPPASGYRDGLRATTIVRAAFDAARMGTPQEIRIE